MNSYICSTCGTQYPPSDQPPGACPICLDERQYIGYGGQQWTTQAQLQAEGFRNEVQDLDPELTEIVTAPRFAIGQRALLLRTAQGNVLWDCVSLLDEAAAAAVQAAGGLQAIAICHPHFYSSMVDWARRFDVPIYLHEDNRRWVMRPDERTVFWPGDEYPLLPGVRLLRLGGHFPGGTVLHWAAGAGGRGALLSGDIINVVADRRWVSFMYSYPNLIPLPAAIVRRIGARIAQYDFERIYGGWPGALVAQDAKAAVARSVDRYIAALEGGVSG